VSPSLCEPSNSKAAVKDWVECFKGHPYMGNKSFSIEDHGGDASSTLGNRSTTMSVKEVDSIRDCYKPFSNCIL